MADVHLGRLVAEFTLDHSKLIENAEQSEQILQQLGQAVAENKKQQQNSNLVIARAAKELKALQRQVEENGKADEEQKGKIAQLNRVIDEEKAKVEQLKREQEKLQQALGDTSESTEQLGENGENLNKTFSSMTVAVGNLISQGINLLISKLGDLAKDVIQTGESFTSAMSEVQAISGATAAQLEILEQTARKYGASTKFSATEAADALKYMALAGWDVQQSTAALGGILDLAAASGMDLAKSSDMVTDYLSAFGMAANQSAYFADLLTYAQGNSNTSAEQLGEAYRNCAANLNAAGQDVETVTSFLEAMANQGKKGSEAGTAMAAIVRDITNKMEDGKIKIGETSIAVQDAAGNFGDLTDILVEVEKATNSMGTAEKAAALSATFTADSINGINLILNEGMSKVSGYEQALRSSSGAAADAAKVMSDNLSGDMKNLGSALDELKLKLYDSAETPLRNIVQIANTQGIAAFEGIIKNLKVVIPIIVGAATAMATLKASLAISSLITKLKTAFDDVTLSEIAATVAAKGFKGVLDSLKADPVIALLSIFTTLISVLGTAIAMNYGNADSIENSNAKTENYLETLQNLKQQEQERLSDIQSESQVLKDLQNEYDNLRKQTNLSAGEQVHLDTVANKLAETLGISTQALKDKNGAYIDITGSVDEYIKKLEEQTRLENATAGLKEAYNAYDNAKKACEDYSKEIDEHTEKIGELENSLSDAKKAVEDFENSYDGNVHQIQFGEYGEEYDRLRTAVEESENELQKEKNALESANDAWFEYYRQAGLATDGIIEYRKELGQTVDVDKEYEERLDNINIYHENYGKIASSATEKTDDMNDSFEEAGKKIAESTEKIEKIKTALENYQKESKTLQSSLSDLAGVYDKLNQGQELDFDTILNLIDKYPDYTKQLLDAADNADSQKKAIELLFEAKKNDYIITQ